MLRTRIIPVLLLRNESLVKTERFGKFTYVGDPCNTVRIFNELEVDELIFLDITASKESRGPNLNILRDIANECFMPLAYGGGIQTVDHAKAVFDIGFEKVAVNTATVLNNGLVESIAKQYGSQAVIASIDVKKGIVGGRRVYTASGSRSSKLDPVSWAKELEQRGAGEILLTSIDREGTWSGFDIELIQSVANAVSIPVVAQGGAGSAHDIKLAIQKGNASAVGLGSMVVYQKKGMGVLVNFPAAINSWNES
jgi:cyclase